MGKVIHWELCKKLRLELAEKWYIHKPEFFQENEAHKILWDLEIQTDHPIQAIRLDQMIINKMKRICHFVDFGHSSWPYSKSKIKQKDKQLIGSY